MKRNAKKLSLHRETLRALDLAGIHGGKNAAPTATEIQPCFTMGGCPSLAVCPSDAQTCTCTDTCRYTCPTFEISMNISCAPC